MGRISAVYPNRLNEASTPVWLDILIDDDAKYIFEAFKQYAKSDKENRMPNIGQLREIAKEIRKREFDDAKILRLQEPEKVESDEEKARKKEIREKCFKILEGGE